MNSTMNSHFHIPLLLFLVLFIFTTSAAKLPSQKGGVDQQINYINSKEPDVKISSVDDDSFDRLMGVEECGNGDEECLRRRAVLEAHLDYIYTQKRIP